MIRKLAKKFSQINKLPLSWDITKELLNSRFCTFIENVGVFVLAIIVKWTKIIDHNGISKQLR